MVLLGYIVLLILVFYLLAKVCEEYFVESLDRIAKKLKLSSDAAGATLMAIGSSAPELFVAIIALATPGGHGEIGAGTIVGSALFNILVIIGAVAIIRKTFLNWQPVLRDTIFYCAAIIILIVTFWNGQVHLWEALMFVGVYVVYIIAVINWKKIFKYKDSNPIPEVEKEVKEDKRRIWHLITKPLDWILEKLFPAKKNYWGIFIVSIIIIATLSWILVQSAIGIAHILHVSEAIIALTILAAGTSLPDMLSSLIVAKRGRGDMAISNAIGSNVFDILIGLGTPWLVYLAFSKTHVTVSTENLLTALFLLFATIVIIIFLLVIRKWRIGKYAGWFLIGLYVIYIIWAVGNL